MYSSDVNVRAMAFGAVMLTLSRLLQEKEDRRQQPSYKNSNSEEKAQC